MIFKTYQDAVAYAREEAKRGLSCRPLFTEGGWQVICTFGTGITAQATEKPPRPYIPLAQQPLTPEALPEIKREMQESFEYQISAPVLREYQREALDAILEGKRITVSIPTGTGKTLVAIGLIARLNFPTVIVVPTLALVAQWRQQLTKAGLPNCEITGENKLLCKFTVTTYQSATLHPERLGGFDVVVFDEVHHLYAPEFRSIVTYIRNAKYILGLTATPARGSESKFSVQQMNLPVGFERGFREMGQYVAPVEIKEVGINLSPEEHENYDKFEKTIRNVTKKLGKIEEWGKFVNSPVEDLRLAALAGFKAMQNMRKQLSESPEKLDEAVKVVRENLGQFIIFSETVESSHLLGTLLRQAGISFVEVNYLSGDREARAKALEQVRNGSARVLIGIRSVEEGIDLPEVANGIFLSSSRMGERYMVQRLGRILRPKEGKVARLYYLYFLGTREEENLNRVTRLV